MNSRRGRRTLCPPGIVLTLILAGCVAPSAQDARPTGTAQNDGTLQLVVQPPANLDPKYQAAGLRRAFTAACQAVGFRIRTLKVDESEFPFLLYGTFEADGDGTPIKAAISAVPGYRYIGSVTSRQGRLHAFAMDITPPEAYPPESAAGNRSRQRERLMHLAGVPADAFTGNRR